MRYQKYEKYIIKKQLSPNLLRDETILWEAFYSKDNKRIRFLKFLRYLALGLISIITLYIMAIFFKGMFTNFELSKILTLLKENEVFLLLILGSVVPILFVFGFREIVILLDFIETSNKYILTDKRLLIFKYTFSRTLKDRRQYEPLCKWNYLDLIDLIEYSKKMVL